MAELLNLSYIVLGVSDLSAWETFAVEIVGMQVGSRASDVLNLRVDDRAQRIMLQQSTEDDLLVAGWETSDEEIGAFLSHFAKLGLKAEEGGTELARARGVERVVRVSDPNGFTHEITCGSAIAASPFRSKALTGPGFVAGQLGVGHVVLFARNYKQTVHFYKEVLNLRISDYIREPLADGQLADVTFFHTRTGRHHSIATLERLSKKRLNHFMVEVQAFADVGFALDRTQKAGYEVAMTLGQHPNDRMFSFYVVTPSGFTMEIGYGGVVIEEATWQVASYSQRSLWGHRRSGHIGTLPPGAND
jgi:2,3-dihydroxybiphenyl 1,2-dioxygenase